MLLSSVLSIVASAALVGPIEPAADERISVMTYNIWVGGTKGDADPDRSRARTLAAMATASPDIVCMQEQSGNAAWYAEKLGYSVLVQDSSTAILTRFKIVEPTKNKWGAQLQTPQGRTIWVFNAHFPAAPYQPYQLAGIPYYDGRMIETAPEAVTEARLARGENAIRCLRDMQPALRTNDLIILCGDFNEPSCLDWTPAFATNFSRKTPVDWPTTRMFIDAGMRDAWRVVHPNPVTTPGFTWTPRPDERDVLDRIDLVLFTGEGWKAKSAEIVGDDPDTELSEKGSTWPSDHFAVRAELIASPK